MTICKKRDSYFIITTSILMPIYHHILPRYHIFKINKFIIFFHLWEMWLFKKCQVYFEPHYMQSYGLHRRYERCVIQSPRSYVTLLANWENKRKLNQMKINNYYDVNSRIIFSWLSCHRPWTWDHWSKITPYRYSWFARAAK